MTIFLVLTVLIEQVLGQRRELVIVHHHSKPLGTVLPDERVDDAERLTRTWSTEDKSGTEGVDNVDPSLSHTFLGNSLPQS